MTATQLRRWTATAGRRLRRLRLDRRHRSSATTTTVPSPTSPWRAASRYSEFGNAQAGMGLGVGDFDGDGQLDLLEDPLRRRHPGPLPQPRAAACSRTSPRRRASARATATSSGAPGLPTSTTTAGRTSSTSPATSTRRSRRSLPAVPAPGPAGRVPQPRRGAASRTSRQRSGPGAVAPHSSRGVAFGDFDNDGDLDVLVMNMNEPPSLLRNDYDGRNGWIEVKLEGTTSNRAGLGATVVVTAEARSRRGPSSASRATTRTTTCACTSAWARARRGPRRGAVAQRPGGRGSRGAPGERPHGARGRRARIAGHDRRAHARSLARFDSRLPRAPGSGRTRDLGTCPTSRHPSGPIPTESGAKTDCKYFGLSESVKKIWLTD